LKYTGVGQTFMGSLCHLQNNHLFSFFFFQVIAYMSIDTRVGAAFGIHTIGIEQGPSCHFVLSHISR